MLFKLKRKIRHMLNSMSMHQLSAWLLSIIFLYLFLSNKYSFKSKKQLVKCLNDSFNVDHEIIDSYNIVNYIDKTKFVLTLNGILTKKERDLFKQMLNANPQIKCGQETRVLTNMLEMRNNWLKSKHFYERILQAGIDFKLVDSATGAFIRELSKQNKQYKYLCDAEHQNKPNDFEFESSLFDYSNINNEKQNRTRHILLIRDPRATIHSIITKEMSHGRLFKNYENFFINWNTLIEQMHATCLKMGPSKCLPIFYEELITNGEETLKSVEHFLNVLPFKQENREAFGKLNGWFNNLPENILESLEFLAPMLRKLGYIYDSFDL